MLKFQRYEKPKTLEDAYALLTQNRNHLILGGMMWLKLQDRTVPCVIDLSDLGLDQIEETETDLKIGAMVTLRQLETSSLLKQYVGDCLYDATKDIVGTQFRNGATIGGSVYGRYGFSDLICALLALDAKVEVYPHGIMSLASFCERGYEKEIVTHILIPKRMHQAKFLCERRSATDFSLINVSVGMVEDHWNIAIGARGKLAQLRVVQKNILPKHATKEEIQQKASEICDTYTFYDNLRGSARYRKHVANVLLVKAIMACLEG